MSKRAGWIRGLAAAGSAGRLDGRGQFVSFLALNSEAPWRRVSQHGADGDNGARSAGCALVSNALPFSLHHERVIRVGNRPNRPNRPISRNRAEKMARFRGPRFSTIREYRPTRTAQKRWENARCGPIGPVGPVFRYVPRTDKSWAQAPSEPG